MKLAAIRGFVPTPSDTNFILIDLKGFGLSSSELTGRMLRHGIIIRDCASFGLEITFEWRYAKETKNRRLIEAIFKRLSRNGEANLQKKR